MRDERRTSVPNGHRQMKDSFRCWIPNGMPMMERNNTTDVEICARNIIKPIGSQRTFPRHCRAKHQQAPNHELRLGTMGCGPTRPTLTI